MSADPAGREDPGLRARLRTGPRSELVTALAVVAAVPLGPLHWVGLVVGGAVVGLVAPSTRRALVLGAYLGGFWAVGFVGWLWLSGVLGRAVATGELFGFSLALAVVLPVLGSAVRGLG